MNLEELKIEEIINASGRFDCCRRQYRNAIYNTLLKLKPVYCFEIGTYLFQTAGMFSAYLQEVQSKGLLITCDVAKWNNSLPPDRVHRVMVYPHTEYIEKNHGNIDVYYKDYRDHVDNSVDLNTNLVRAKMDELGIDLFDLAFVDGDHEGISFLRDLTIAKSLVKEDGYLIIDDIFDPNHCQIEEYASLAKKNNFYEYKDWSPVPGIALIKNKDLVI